MPSPKSPLPSRKRSIRRNKPKKPEAPRVPAVDPTTSQALRHLRGLGHAMDPVLHIGKEGLSDAVVEAAREALLTHELIKVKVLSEAPLDRKEVAALLASRTESVLAQVLGRTFLLFKRHPTKPRLVLPGA